MSQNVMTSGLEAETVNVLVLGVGNVLLSDEGAGVRAVEELQKRYVFAAPVEVVDGGTCGMELLGCLDDRSHLFIIDAIRSGREPGAVTRIALDDPPAFFRRKISPHQIGLSELLAVAALTDALPPHIVLFGIEPQFLETGLAVSPPVADQMEHLVEMVVSEVRALGIRVDPAAF